MKTILTIRVHKSDLQDRSLLRQDATMRKAPRMKDRRARRAQDARSKRREME